MTLNDLEWPNSPYFAFFTQCDWYDPRKIKTQRQIVAVIINNVSLFFAIVLRCSR